MDTDWRAKVGQVPSSHLGGALVGAVAGGGVLGLARWDDVERRHGDSHSHHAAVVLSQFFGEVHSDAAVVSCCNHIDTHICHISSIRITSFTPFINL
jgi:hypothetical protein